MPSPPHPATSVDLLTSSYDYELPDEAIARGRSKDRSGQVKISVPSNWGEQRPIPVKATV